jgi:hypothetical protein
MVLSLSQRPSKYNFVNSNMYIEPWAPAVLSWNFASHNVTSRTFGTVAANSSYKLITKVVIYIYIYIYIKQTPWLESASKLYWPSDNRLSATLVPTFADIGYHMVSVTDPCGRNLDFFRPEPLLFLSSSSSFVLMRMTASRSRPTSQKIW